MRYLHGITKGYTKTEFRTLQKVEDELRREMEKQIHIVMGCAAIAIYENWDYETQDIANFYEQMVKEWNEVIKNKDVSIIEMCENETGIIIDIPGFTGNYKDLLYFQTDVSSIEISIQKKIVMRQKQKKWMAAEVLASALLSVYHLLKFDDETIMTFFEKLLEVRERYDFNEKTILKESEEITGVIMKIE